MNNHSSRNWGRPLDLDISVSHPADYVHRYRMDSGAEEETCRIKEIFGMLLFTLSVLCFALGIYLF